MDEEVKENPTTALHDEFFNHCRDPLQSRYSPVLPWFLYNGRAVKNYNECPPQTDKTANFVHEGCQTPQIVVVYNGRLFVQVRDT